MLLLLATKKVCCLLNLSVCAAATDFITISMEVSLWICGGVIMDSSLSTEQAAGVYHRESRKGRYQLTYKEAKAVCEFEGGKLATYDQLEAARKIGL